ncbi:ABC transporter ATP-binding protein [Acetobacterium carbinolicum]|uniref:ABC transporter ATP-binding protein n=1 Tax=Acetobacterium TaxID=33951 RepID=UPI000DBECB1A|nr:MULTISPECIES: ABC transporter ATP-binding protein [unclassified Acetobacterium]AWW27597.1 iron ABC transporter ATP-binding protein [Acetobacterium sp. KB-1]MDK2935500.1 iron complex transport system ATP-binding protein [Eubacteriaceae bacterium]MDZ5724114.1 ABC transporter ATP-binding protein [Acetobacterium sp. K1/6]
MNLQVEGLAFDYPCQNVLKGISFSMKRGECLAILGTNGAGKSTLLKCINKILKPQGGSVLIDQENIKAFKQSELAQRVAYVSQSNQSTTTTVFDSILIGRKPYIKWDVGKNDLNIVNETIKMLNLEKFALKNVDELSGGEYQKVLIGRALAQETDVLMLDEPTSSLDLKNQLEVLQLIKEIAYLKNITAVVTIHDLNLALRFADQYILLKDGVIHAAGGKEVITEANIKEVYGVDVTVEQVNNRSVVVPI